MKWIKRGGMIVFGLLLAGGVVYGLLPQPVPSEFGQVTRGDIQSTIDEEGRTRLTDTFTVFAPVAGEIERIDLRVGDTVDPANPIAIVSPAKPTPLTARDRMHAEAAIRAAEAYLEQMKAAEIAADAEAEYAQREHERLLGLPRGIQISTNEIDVAATRERAAKAGLRSAQFARSVAAYQLEMARAQLVDDAEPQPARIRIASPIAGRVLAIYRRSAGPIMAGEKLVEVGSPDSLEIVAELLSTDAVGLRHGMPVSIERWGGSFELSGEVRLVEQYGFTKTSALGVEEQRVNVVIDFTSASEQRAGLGPGYRVEVRIVVEERRDVLKLPESAVFSTPTGPAVFAVRDGRAAQVSVELGTRNGLEAELLSGLNEGDSIVVNPSDTLMNGSAVKAR